MSRKAFMDWDYPYNFMWTLIGIISPKREDIVSVNKIKHLRKNIEDALNYINADEDVRKFIDLRFKKRKTMDDVARIMGVTLSKCRNMQIQMFRKLHTSACIWIINNGIDTLELRYAMHADKKDITIYEMDDLLDTRTMGALCRVRVLRENGPDWLRTAGDILKLYEDGEINYIRGLGIRGIAEVLTPAMKKLGFTDEDLRKKGYEVDEN